MTKGDTEVSCKQPQSSWKSDDGFFQHRNETFIVRGTLSSPAKKKWEFELLSNVLCSIMAGSFHRNSKTQSNPFWCWVGERENKQKSIIKSLPSWKIDFFSLYARWRELAMSHESSAAVQQSTAICMAYSSVREASSCNASNHNCAKEHFTLFPLKSFDET